MAPGCAPPSPTMHRSEALAASKVGTRLARLRLAPEGARRPDLGAPNPPELLVRFADVHSHSPEVKRLYAGQSSPRTPMNAIVLATKVGPSSDRLTVR